MRKIYMLTMSLFICMGALAGNNGSIGENLKWAFTDDGTLTISGTGKMEHADGNSGYAWGTDNHTLNRSLIKKVVVEEGVTTLGEYIFWDCQNLTEVSLPKSLTALKKECFKSCPKLKEITLPDNITLIDESAFEECKALETVTFPKNLKEIKAKAFHTCNLKKVDLSQTQVETIGMGAFAHNANCTEVYLPKTLTTFFGTDEGAFGDCKSLKKAVCLAVNPPQTLDGGEDWVYGGIKMDPVDYVNIFTGTDDDFVLEVPAGSEEKYRNADGWKNVANNITTGIRGVKASQAKVGVYDITGKRYMNHADAQTVNTLQRGVYIINGKKVLVK
ncbi:leucine-rich repeat domain-containing protein [Hoylesella timonensis]|uniref:leucine-rich repeat domain-containing protein n=1 Tax=Hoylesella timonensis TaxID=386414 RepID=UPI00288C2524|nr:leucine-rich repeat domain-containing protein [Hoylesella timonensis]